MKKSGDVLVSIHRAWLLATLVSGASALSLACSGENTSDAGGHAGASDGHAGAGTSGQGGANASPAAQGNLTLVIQPPAAGSATCPVPGKTYVLGDPKGPDSTSPGDRLIDGQDGTSITCSVRGSGLYAFSGKIRGLSSEGDTVTVTLADGVVNQDKVTGTATMAVFTPQLASTFSSAAGACALTVIGQNVKAGSLWATVSCASISNPSSPGNSCAIGAITAFVLENCDDGEP